MLLVLADLTPKLAPLLGGSHYLTLLFPLLENLASQPEQEMRNTATKSLMELLDNMNIVKSESFVKSLLQRQFNSENYVSLEVFCRLSAHIYPVASEGL